MGNDDNDDDDDDDDVNTWFYSFNVNNYNYRVSSCLAAKFLQRCNWQVAAAPWWLPVKGAYWRRPEGPDSHIRDRYTN